MILLLSGCLNLDGFVFNAVPCSAVGPETCDGGGWDALCVPCDEPYDWGRSYDWMPGTLAEGEDVRPIPDDHVEAFTLPTDDGAGELDAYFVTAHGDDPAAAQVTIVYNHGNYGNIEHYQPRVRFLYEAGYNVLVWDYRGYGKTLPETTPTAAQHLSDARLVLAEAAARAPDPERLVVYGYSLGAIAATEMAVQDRSCALVLEAPFTSMSSIAEGNTSLSLGEQLFSSGQWDNFDRMARYGGPVLGMSGTEDDLFATDEVGLLVAAGSGPSELWRVPGGHHGIGDAGVPETAGLADYAAHLHDFLTAQGCE